MAGAEYNAISLHEFLSGLALLIGNLGGDLLVSLDHSATAWLRQQDDVEAEASARWQTVDLKDFTCYFWGHHLFIEFFLLEKAHFGFWLIEL